VEHVFARFPFDRYARESTHGKAKGENRFAIVLKVQGLRQLLRNPLITSYLKMLHSATPN
jgi:hypothetical protein